MSWRERRELRVRFIHLSSLAAWAGPKASESSASRRVCIQRKEWFDTSRRGLDWFGGCKIRNNKYQLYGRSALFCFSPPPWPPSMQ